MLKFVKNFPGVMIRNDTLVIADLHIGFELELLKKGIRVPDQHTKMLKVLVGFVEKSHVKELIVAGDVKHKVPGSTKKEETMVREFLETMSEFVDVTIVPGNHDAGLEKLVSGLNVKVEDVKGIVKQNYGLFHGHAWPKAEIVEKAKILIMGHVHPIIKTASGQMRVFVKTKLNEEKLAERYQKVKSKLLLVLPAFNELVGGVDLSKSLEEELVGPVMMSVAMLGEAEYITLAGQVI